MRIGRADSRLIKRTIVTGLTYTVLMTDELIAVNYSSGHCVIVLPPDAYKEKGWSVIVKDEGLNCSDTNKIIVGSYLQEANIENFNYVEMMYAGDSIQIYATGTKYGIVG